MKSVGVDITNIYVYNIHVNVVHMNKYIVDIQGIFVFFGQMLSKFTSQNKELLQTNS